MKPIRIDFAPRSLLRAVVRTHPMTWLLGAIGLGLCANVAFSAWTATERYRAREADLMRMQAQLADRIAHQPRPKPTTIAAPQAAAVNRAIAQLNLPWRDVWDAVEAATPATVALWTLEPDAKKQVVRGSAETKTSDAMIAYVEQLKQQSFFDAVVLTKHEINEQDANKPIRFQFEAHWTERAP